MTTEATGPRVYVGTYAKYNNGSIAGKWLDLEDYADKNDFLEACRKLHNDEADPELMFQDYEGFPSSYYSESNISEELWDWLDLDDDDRELLTIYRDHVSDSGTIDDARDAYAGKADSEANFAAELLEETGDLEAIPENLRNYFDYKAYARDLQLGGDCVFIRQDGYLWVFWTR